MSSELEMQMSTMDINLFHGTGCGSDLMSSGSLFLTCGMCIMQQEYEVVVGKLNKNKCAFYEPIKSYISDTNLRQALVTHCDPKTLLELGLEYIDTYPELLDAVLSHDGNLSLVVNSPIWSRLLHEGKTTNSVVYNKINNFITRCVPDTLNSLMTEL